MWLITGALAGSLAGTSLPSVGGGFAGPTEHGALGIITQPAAVGRGDAPELVIDIAAVSTRFDQWAQGWDEPIVTQGVATQPTVMLAVPIGRFGIGASIHSSYRRGTNYGPEGPLRLFLISSNLFLLEADLVGSYRLTEHLTLGAGLRAGKMEYTNFKGTDLGASLNRSLEPNPPLPIGDPLLQGTQELGPLSTLTASFLVGASLELEQVQLDLSFRPQWAVSMQGPVQLRPSTALNTTVDGTIDLTLKFPAHLVLAARVPVSEAWTLIPELEWVGWRSASKNSAVISNLALSSSDPTFNTLLSTSGLSEADFIKSQEGPTNADLGWNDVVNASLQGIFVPREDVELRAGVGYSPSAIPEQRVTPSNIDFGGFSFKLGAAWHIAAPIRVGLTGERYQMATRHVTNSPYSLTDPLEGLPTQPSGNGNYAFSLWRAGLTLQLFIPQKGGS